MPGVRGVQWRDEARADRPAEDIDVESSAARCGAPRAGSSGLPSPGGRDLHHSSMMRPLYTSEARILIQNDESSFTRPATDRVAIQHSAERAGGPKPGAGADSRDLAVEVIKDSTSPTIGPSPRTPAPAVGRLLTGSGSARIENRRRRRPPTPSPASQGLPAHQVERDRRRLHLGRLELATKIANKLADGYIDWQRDAKLEQTKDATLAQRPDRGAAQKSRRV